MPIPNSRLWLVVSGHGLASLWAAPRRTRFLSRLRCLASCRRSSQSDLTVDGRPAMWVPGTVRDLHNYWVRYMAWLERHDIEHDGQTFNGQTFNGQTFNGQTCREGCPGRLGPAA